ncbi:GNAT family N-acetyltransferase [Serinicoccus sp. LYQ131]|uniref:GNAT family N-acetyltransferase n=1 Tax=Serinicoccus sp. LYQ131 TaxID=3378797 RepID=UPI003854D589
MSDTVTLEQADAHTGALDTIFARVADEVDVDLERELRAVHRERRPRRPLKLSNESTTVRRFAVCDAGRVVGYVAGRFGGGIPGVSLPDDAVGAFVRLVLVDPSERGRELAGQAICAFAQEAYERGATHIGLRLDTTDPVEPRRRAFRRLGFDIEQPTPTLPISDLVTPG